MKNISAPLIVFLFFHQHLLEVFYYCPSIWTEPGWIHWLDLKWFQSQVTVGNVADMHPRRAGVHQRSGMPASRKTQKTRDKQRK